MHDFLKEWPILDTLDFEAVTFDATKWEDGTYTVIINFCEPNEADEPPYSGYSLCTQLGGTTLEQIYVKIRALIDSGLFDGIAVNGVGILWNEVGDQIDEINWLSYETSTQFPEEIEIDAQSFKITGNTTLQ